jgi:tRNA threonylcarbamoyladenosine modification (KEOPS) complex  Pcc1 subunit
MTDTDNQTSFYQIVVSAEDGYLDELKDILESSETPIDITNGDRCDMTPLHFAASKGHLPVVELLVNNGAFLDASNIWDKTPLHFAANNGHLDVVQYLVEKGARTEATSNKKRFTPLHLAAQFNHRDVVKYLVESGANAVALSEDGKTPYDLTSDDEVRAILYTAALPDASNDRMGRRRRSSATIDADFESIQREIEAENAEKDKKARDLQKIEAEKARLGIST